MAISNPVMDAFGPYNESTGDGWNTNGPLWTFPGSGRPGVNQGASFKYIAGGGGGSGGTGAQSRYCSRAIPTNQTRYQVLAARVNIFHFTRNLGNAQAGMYLQGLDANGNTCKLRVERASTAGKLSIIWDNSANANEVTVYESDDFIAGNTYNYIELMYDMLTHSVRWRINRREQPGGALPALPAPLPNNNFTPNAMLFGFGTANGQFFQNVTDCFAYCDPPGGNFIGDYTIEYFRPTSDEVPQDWTANGVANGYEALDNDPANTAEYIEAATVADESLFGVSISQIGMIAVGAVAVQYTGRKTDAAAGDCQSSLVSNGTTDDGADNAMPDTTYQQFYDPYPLNPDGNTDWVPSAVTTLEILKTRTA